MSIVDHKEWDLSGRSIRDSQRHRNKIDEHIRKNVKDVIAEESIISRKSGKTVKIPVRGLKDYRFVYRSSNGNKAGAGQGPANPGDVIGRKQKDQQGKDGKAGNQLGDDIIETEVDIDYLIKIMFEDLGLPYIEEKIKTEQLIPVGWKFDSISKVGTRPRIHKKKTLIESIKRTALYVSEIINETGCSEDDAYRSLVQSFGDLEEAIKIVKDCKVDPNVNPDDIFIEDDDLRFKQIEEEMEPHSNCVIYAMMDTSGSMSTDKKYLARSFLFWLVQFLKKSYNNVAIEFIVHTTEAKVVDEDTFFKKGESGGTYCHTAFDLASYLIETKYPIDMWNQYVIYCSDGEDFDTNKTIDSINTILSKDINMLGYLEIIPSSYPTYENSQSLLDKICKSFNFKISTENGKNYYKDVDKHILACKITSKDDVYPALKHLLFTPKKGN